MMNNKLKKTKEIIKLEISAKKATRNAKRENRALGLSEIVVKKNGIYLKNPEGKLKLLKKGDYGKVKIKNKIYKR